MRAFKHWIIAVFVFGLCSCASLQPPQPAAQNKNITWDQRVHTLSEIQTWDLKAMIAIRQQNDAWSANLQWQQQSKNYHISLFGPLGTNSVELTGHPGHVELANAKGQRFNASSPELLLKQQLGQEVPVSNLYYWVRGIPVPGIPSQTQLDKYNHLIQLKQQGWVINYLSYASINNVDMPNKIFMNNPTLNVKLVINHWQL